jgi:hypothetical protein
MGPPVRSRASRLRRDAKGGGGGYPRTTSSRLGTRGAGDESDEADRPAVTLQAARTTPAISCRTTPSMERGAASNETARLCTRKNKQQAAAEHSTRCVCVWKSGRSPLLSAQLSARRCCGWAPAPGTPGASPGPPRRRPGRRTCASRRPASPRRASSCTCACRRRRRRRGIAGRANRGVGGGRRRGPGATGQIHPEGRAADGQLTWLP